MSERLEVNLVDLYSTIDGRIRRTTFFVAGSGLMVLSVLTYGVFAFGVGDEPLGRVLGCMVFFMPSFALHIRRLHDLGRSGNFAILLIIPVINLALWLYLLLTPGIDGPNEFGSRPCSVKLAV
jgi:uncharacterized membrane protein YhaH (DUF805 family)